MGEQGQVLRVDATTADAKVTASMKLGDPEDPSELKAVRVNLGLNPKLLIETGAGGQTWMRVF